MIVCDKNIQLLVEDIAFCTRAMWSRLNIDSYVIRVALGALSPSGDPHLKRGNLRNRNNEKFLLNCHHRWKGSCVCASFNDSVGLPMCGSFLSFPSEAFGLVGLKYGH